MTATHTPVEVAHAHMIVESHRRLVDDGTIDPDELLEAAEVLADEVRALRAKPDMVWECETYVATGRQPAPPKSDGGRGAMPAAVVTAFIGFLIAIGAWELGELFFDWATR
jgi:hypothetical protein